jgi:hypothetical protein
VEKSFGRRRHLSFKSGVIAGISELVLGPRPADPRRKPVASDGARADRDNASSESGEDESCCEAANEILKRH